MTDTTSDDVYNDPDNILQNTDDSVQGGVELPQSEMDDLTQTIFTPERDINDPRGPLDLGAADPEYEPGVSRDNGLDSGDGDANRPADVIVPDEQDGTEA